MGQRQADHDEEQFTEVFSWGNDNSGQLGLGPRKQDQNCIHSVPRYCSFNVPILSMACGKDHTIFITTQNIVYSMGSNAHGQLGIGEMNN